MYRKETIEKFWNRVDRSVSGCWNWTGAKTTAGYGSLTISRKRFYAHRLAFEFSRRALQPNELVMHICDNPLCCNPDHLRAGSHADNMADMAEKGRANGGGPSGSRQGSSKLTEAQVADIRVRYNGKNRMELAREFGVTPPTINYVLTKGWKHVPQRNCV